MHPQNPNFLRNILVLGVLFFTAMQFGVVAAMYYYLYYKPTNPIDIVFRLGLASVVLSLCFFYVAEGIQYFNKTLQDFLLILWVTTIIGYLALTWPPQFSLTYLRGCILIALAFHPGVSLIGQIYAILRYRFYD